MIVAALALFGLFTGAAGLACSGGLSYSESGVCAAGQGTPDCSYIQNHVWSICDIMLNGNEVVRSDMCSVTGAGGGCSISYPAQDVQSVFCCVLAPPPPTYTAIMTVTPSSSASASATASVATMSSSASQSAAPTLSATMSGSASQSAAPTLSATHAPMYVPEFIFNSATDFSGFQGNNGWYYMFTTGKRLTRILEREKKQARKKKSK